MFLFIDKPTGFTSYDVIHKIKKLYPRKTKIGHAGTLDPLATGLMIIAIGKDTKKLGDYSGLDKKYIATIDFSKKSDTWDIDYRKEYEELDVSSIEKLAPSKNDIEDVLKQKLGTHLWPLTPFSARKIKGKKLYEYAREGNPVFMDVEMELLGFEIQSYSFPILELELHVGSGTYVRSIAHRLGEQFNVGGILLGLRRTEIGTHKI